MDRFTVEVKCEAGHSQTIQVAGLAREWVESWCGLLDGTSAMYVARPCDDPNSVIGKCMMPCLESPVCGRQVHASIVGVEASPDDQSNSR